MYNLRFNSSKSGALLSTKSGFNLLKPIAGVHNHQLIHQTLNLFITKLFTPKTVNSPLFEYNFYPVSTAPIIKTNKERI